MRFRPHAFLTAGIAAMELDVPEIAIPMPAGVMAAAIAVFCGGAVASLMVAGVIVARRRRGLPAVSPRPRLAASWTGLEVAVAATLFLWLQVMASAVVPANASLHVRLAAGATAMLAATAVTAMLLVAWGADRAALGFGPVRLRDDSMLAVASLTLVLTPLLALAAVLDRLVPYRHLLIDFLAAHRDPVAVGLVAFAAIVAAPVAEEFLFRRVLQGWLERREPEWGWATPILLSSLAFAVSHVGQGLAWVPLFFFGAVAGYLARQTGSIVPGIILHALFNAVSVALVLAQTSPTAAGGG
jgi:membrane protease YdiL (CAAX protease family)